MHHMRKLRKMGKHLIVILAIILLGSCTHRKIVIAEPAAIEVNPVVAAAEKR